MEVVEFSDWLQNTHNDHWGNQLNRRQLCCVKLLHTCSLLHVTHLCMYSFENGADTEPFYHWSLSLLLCKPIVLRARKLVFIRYLTRITNFSDEFLAFLVQADADIQADALRFSTRFRCNFPQDSTRKAGFRRGFVWKMANQQVRMYVAMYSASTYTRNTLPS